ncbi:hypothetical protein Droror1_Dr00017817 [Drosera rotundifolia]
MLDYGWGWSFVLSGLLVMLMGIVVYGFLATSPDVVGFESDDGGVELKEESDTQDHEKAMEGESLSLLQSKNVEDSGFIEPNAKKSNDAIGFLEAWRLPGMASFAFCLFLSKLVAYAFLYWLPFYIRHTKPLECYRRYSTLEVSLEDPTTKGF